MILKESLKFIQWKLQINSVKHNNILSEHLKKKVQTHANQATDGQAGRRLKRIAIVVYVSITVFQSLMQQLGDNCLRQSCTFCHSQVNSLLTLSSMAYKDA